MRQRYEKKVKSERGRGEKCGALGGHKVKDEKGKVKSKVCFAQVFYIDTNVQIYF